MDELRVERIKRFAKIALQLLLDLINTKNAYSEDEEKRARGRAS